MNSANNSLASLSDRHFRPDPQGVLASREEVRCGRVLVTVAPAAATTPAGQHLAWMLINLLARQFGVVVEITLDVPDAQLLNAPVFFGARDRLHDTLAECIRAVAGHHVRVGTAPDESKDYDVAIVVGGKSQRQRAEHTWCVYADGWRWHVGTGERMPTEAPSSGLSFGPYLAASFAAGEVFKVLRGLRPNKGEFIVEVFGCAWSMTTSDTWEELPVGPDTDDIAELPHFYFAGAGAVAQAAAACLAASKIKGRATCIDHDALDLSNDNRYVLSTIDDDGTPKVKLLSKRLNSSGLYCHPAEMKWDKYVGTLGKRAIDSSVTSLEQQYLYPLVLSCVDKNVPRHEIQKVLPGTIIGGSTDGLAAKAQVFFLGHDSACLKCHNLIEDRDELLRQNRLLLNGMTREQQSAWCLERAISEEVLQKFLAPPECGKLTEGDLERFALGQPEMSVGFVSLAAGVLLSAQLIRVNHLGITEATADGHLVMATFAKAGLRSRKVGPAPLCDCVSVSHTRWDRMWNR